MRVERTTNKFGCLQKNNLDVFSKLSKKMPTVGLQKILADNNKKQSVLSLARNKGVMLPELGFKKA